MLIYPMTLSIHVTNVRTCYRCDRILSFGAGMKLLNYRRSELKLSDHRPVTATFMAEVEVFSHRKLQKALTLTDAEIEERDLISDMDLAGISHLRLGEVCLCFDDMISQLKE